MLQSYIKRLVQSLKIIDVELQFDDWQIIGPGSPLLKELQNHHQFYLHLHHTVLMLFNYLLLVIFFRNSLDKFNIRACTAETPGNFQRIGAVREASVMRAPARCRRWLG